MREYELLYIVSGDKSESEATAAQDSVTAVLADHKAKTEAEDNWGRRRLAYQIDKQEYGWYKIVRFSVDPAQTPEIQRALNLNDAVVRSLIVGADDLPTDAEKAAQAERAEKYSKSSDDDRAKSAPRKPAPTAKAEPAIEHAPAKKKEAPAEPQLSEAERKAKLEEKLGEILKDDDDNAANA